MKKRKESMTIAIGDKLPNAVFKTMTASGPADKTTSDVFAGKRVALFAVPGAFTPTCSRSHLPGFLDNLDALKAKGVDTVACTAVNDAFVLDAWGKASGADGKVLFLADGSGTFAKAVGLDLDLGAGGLGLRSKRYSMLVEDGVVKALHVEDQTGTAVASSAEALLADL
jgi:glutaredoxin/glutathione-dependent peroxiredoxin